MHMDMINVAKEIERLIQYAKKNKIIEENDVITSRNALMDLLNCAEPYNEENRMEDIKNPSEILENLLNYALAKGLLVENSITNRDLFDTKIMGVLMPRQSEVIRNFLYTKEKQGIEKATDEFYALSQTSNYIRMDRIGKNLSWLHTTEYGNLEITINLSKPEKDPKEIVASRLKPEASYPKCLLCKENVGFAGHINNPARQNHRIIPVGLGEEKWYFQYSPYVYYNEHCILFHEEHLPMKISDKTFERLIEFVQQFPHYFIGSNADLPIVGGSILSHEHFQGGRHSFPMEQANVETWFKHDDYNTVKVGIVKWPMSVIRLSSCDKEELLVLAKHILKKWCIYNDVGQEILAFTKNGDELIPHNTITPIARKNKSGEFEIDIVLRNNVTSEEYPDGIFHPHQGLHHIKKENIGLIEVMGLAVLPGRLRSELNEIEGILEGSKEYDQYICNKESEMYKHVPWIEYLVNKYGKKNSLEESKLILQKEVGNKFLQVLLDAGVYKKTEVGMEGFITFMKHVGFKLEKDKIE